MSSPQTTEAPPPAPPPPPPPEVLLPALAAFDRGDFAAATAAARPLADAPDPEVQAAARALLARLAPDPWAIRLGLLALIVLALVAALYVH